MLFKIILGDHTHDMFILFKSGTYAINLTFHFVFSHYSKQYDQSTDGGLPLPEFAGWDVRQNARFRNPNFWFSVHFAQMPITKKKKC